jgi:hypothetical protein
VIDKITFVTLKSTVNLLTQANRNPMAIDVSLIISHSKVESLCLIGTNAK